MPFSERVLQAIDQLVADTGTADHPSLRAWSAGEFARDDLRTFASEFYHLVDALPRAVARTHAGTEDQAMRRPLVGVLAALDASAPTPTELWLQTCAALGLFSDSVRRAELSAGARGCIGTLEAMATGGPVTGSAALYALLRQLPVVCRITRDGLRDHYGMDSGPGLAFFDAFLYQTQTQAAALREVLAAAIRSDEDTAHAQAAAGDMLAAFDGLLAGSLAGAPHPVG
jgi:pyrroloquinoline-quinone synthase